MPDNDDYQMVGITAERSADIAGDLDVAGCQIESRCWLQWEHGHLVMPSSAKEVLEEIVIDILAVKPGSRPAVCDPSAQLD